MRTILVTSALPYANGPLHLGHMVEYIQTDIWVRFQRMRGHVCRYVCADDAHGTPIMLRADQEGVSPADLIKRINREHQRDFAGFGIAFDHYHSTHSPENRHLSELIYTRNRDQNHITRRAIRQAYDPEKRMFLPDRFVKGECPRCGTADQYGDSCEQCGATYTPLEMKNPVSALSGATPIEKTSEHLFFKLGDFERSLKDWHDGGHVQAEIANKLNEWFEAGLSDWDISRDAPYWGFEIPGETGKYFYVWLDAPIGYMASFKNLCDREGLDFDAYWNADSQAELYHFIGKDIIYFHALFWPAMLHGAGLRMPSGVFAHGFLTVNGQKMSKSRGTFIMAETYLKHLNPEYLRYYFAAKLGPGIDDLDLNLEDFRLRVNSDVVGKVVNIASRCAGFINKRFGHKLSTPFPEPALYETFVTAGDAIADCYEKRDYNRAMREIMVLADRANQYINDKKPWALAKEEGKEQEIQDICSVGLNLFRILTAYLKPVLPAMAKQAEAFLQVEPMTWSDVAQPLAGHEITAFHPLMQRVEEGRVNAMIEDSKTQTEAAAPSTDSSDSPKNPPISEEIAFADFAKVDLRVARIEKAEYVEDADKLLRLTLDLGGETRNVFAGLKSAYDPDDLTGRLTLMVANLAPRKMKFGLSEGMILAAGPSPGASDKDLFILSPDSGAQPGMKVK